MTRHRIHWTHLLLLAALPVWFLATAGFANETRLAGWFVMAAAALGVAERRCPFRRDWVPDRPALQRDGSVFALNAMVDGALTVVIAAGVLALDVPTASFPLWAQIVVGLAAGELASYTIHRASHRDGWLWSVHLLHHRPRRLNLANALTAHPFNAVYEKLARVLPMVLVGLSDDAVLAITLFALTQNLVAHANVAGTIGPLNYVIGSVELHRLHHSTVEEDAGNFGTAVPWWDLVFGTYRAASRSPRDVGVFDPRKYPGEFDVARLLLWPLGTFVRKWRVCCT